VALLCRELDISDQGLRSARPDRPPPPTLSPELPNGRSRSRTAGAAAHAVLDEFMLANHRYSYPLTVTQRPVSQSRTASH
jgi:hypothetical protein